jgi:succinate dehydrogenase/fumarate reductase flavoprotein subunit
VEKESFRVNLLVIGAGMTGLTAAAAAARRGLDVLVVEKAAEIGGSAALSEGYMWTAPTLEALQWEDPDCDPLLGSALADHFPEGIGWVRSLGVELSGEITGIYHIGRGYQVDIGTYLDRCRSVLEAGGGWISTEVQVRELRRGDGRVTGALALDRDGGEVEISADWTLLATGGFSADPELRRTYIGPGADHLLLRANPHSTGDGLRLGTSVGARVAGGQGLYGHLIAAPLEEFEPKDYLNFAQLHSGYCLLLNRSGERFTDESLGDHVNNQAVLRQPEGRAVLIGDEYARRTHVMSAYIKGMDIMDKLQFAAAAGANYAVADTFGALAERATGWGYDPAAAERTLAGYVASRPGSLSPPSERYSPALDEPPYFALEVQPAITFPYAGLATDVDGLVFGDDGPIEGLLAGGVDVGGVYKRGYAGALARGLVSGLRAAITAAGEPSWRQASAASDGWES